MDNKELRVLAENAILQSKVAELEKEVTQLNKNINKTTIKIFRIEVYSKITSK